MRDLLHAYWLAGGKVSELRFGVKLKHRPIADWANQQRLWYSVEAFDARSGITQFVCGHKHESEGAAKNCSRALEYLRIEMGSNLVG